MNRIAELKKFTTSHHMYYGLRMTFAVVLPCIILAYLGILKEYFMFPFATLMMTTMDQPGSFIRRRNTFILAIISFFVVSLTICFTHQYPILVAAEVVIFGFFFAFIGIYGIRLMMLGSMTLVIFSILIEGSFSSGGALKTSIILTCGGVWAFVVFLVVSKVRPYTLARQMLGDSFVELGNFLRIKSKFYQPKPHFHSIFEEMMSSEIKLKHSQEDLREILFTTRRYLQESTTTSRMITLMFLESIDLFEQILTSQQDYKELHKKFVGKDILPCFQRYIEIVSSELINIGMSVQRNNKAIPVVDIDEELLKCHKAYYDLRDSEVNSDNFQDFMMLRQILMNLSEITKKVKTIYRASNYDEKLAKSLSFGLDFDKFAPKVESFSLKLLRSNFSLKSVHFRHAIRIATSLLIGYLVSNILLGYIGHSFWILMTILAVQKPAFSIAKSRNFLRLKGTIAGAIVGFLVLYYVTNTAVIFTILLISLTLCYAFLRYRYMPAIFFMTIYLFMYFHMIFPNSPNVILDRVLDTAIGCVISFAVTHLVLPVWEKNNIKLFIINSINANKSYFDVVCEMMRNKSENFTQKFKEKRKEALIALANLSDGFQRMLSDPRFKKDNTNIKRVHLFVNTTHLVTAYTASLSMYAQREDSFQEIDVENWRNKIMLEFTKMQIFAGTAGIDADNIKEYKKDSEPSDKIETLLEKRRREIIENEISYFSDPERMSRLTQLKSIHELFALINNVVEEQMKIIEKFKNNEIQQSETIERKKSSKNLSLA